MKKESLNLPDVPFRLLGVPRLWFSLVLTLSLTLIVILIAVRLSTQLKNDLLERFQHEQQVSVYHQAQRLKDVLRSITNDLVSLSSREALIYCHEGRSRELLREFYRQHQSFVVAGYRMDRFGVLKCVEGKDRAGEGFDISGQTHVQELFQTGQTVISGSFKAVEGYYAIAIHVPVFRDGQLDGSLATLVRWDGLKNWFNMSRKNDHEFIMLVDRDFRIVFHPLRDYVGMRLDKIPELLADDREVSPAFFFEERRFVAKSPSLGAEPFAAATQPFVFEKIQYALVYGAPLETILGPVNRNMTLTILLAGVSVLIITVSLIYLMYSYFQEQHNREKYQADVSKESRERELAQKHLKETRDTFLTVLNSIDATIYVSEIDTHRILFMNRSMEEDFNITDWENKLCYRVFRNQTAPCRNCTNPKLLDGEGNPTGVHIWEDENPVTGKWYQNFDRAIRWIDGRMVRIQIATDISSLKVYEAQQQEMAEALQRAQKMEALGTLAGGVAHDLNNVLSGIVTHPELMLMDLPEDSPLVEPLKAIHSSGRKAAEIVNDLLTLGRRGVSVSEIVDLNDVISDYLASPEYAKLKTYHPKIQIESRLDPEAILIKGSPIHLRKTVMNLVSNAAEAHLAEGRVDISTRLEYLEKPPAGYDEVVEGMYAVLEVTDQGTGISSDDTHRIFEPFYTKKVMGRSGTGLGMAVVWGTVQDHGGYIGIASEEGRGTTMTIYFPLTDEKAAENAASVPLASLRGNREQLLVVDDVSEQRMIAGSVLEKLNYAVSTVENGEKAIDAMKQNSYDLLIVDMIMDPGMDGLDTCRQALEINPVQKIIIASGFSETKRVKEALALGACAYIKKPYRLEDLGVAVRNALAG